MEVVNIPYNIYRVGDWKGGEITTLHMIDYFQLMVTGAKNYRYLYCLLKSILGIYLMVVK